MSPGRAGGSGCESEGTNNKAVLGAAGVALPQVPEVLQGVPRPVVQSTELRAPRTVSPHRCCARVLRRWHKRSQRSGWAAGDDEPWLFFGVRLEKEGWAKIWLFPGRGRGARGRRRGDAVLAAGQSIRAQCGSAYHSCVGPVEAGWLKRTPRSPRNEFASSTRRKGGPVSEGADGERKDEFPWVPPLLRPPGPAMLLHAVPRFKIAWSFPRDAAVHCIAKTHLGAPLVGGQARAASLGSRDAQRG